MKYRVIDKKVYKVLLLFMIIPSILLIVGVAFLIIGVSQQQSSTPNIENWEAIQDVLQIKETKQEINWGMITPAIMFMVFGVISDSMILGIMLLTRKYYKRHLYALTGTKRMGKVLACYNQSRSHSGRASIVVEVEYKTDSNNTAILMQDIDTASQYLFTLGNGVPVYVKDEYGYVNVQELRKQESIIE